MYFKNLFIILIGVIFATTLSACNDKKPVDDANINDDLSSSNENELDADESDIPTVEDTLPEVDKDDAFNTTVKDEKQSADVNNDTSENIVKEEGIYYVTNTALNVRSDVGTSHSIIGTVHFNAEVQVTGRSAEGWYEIEYNNDIGYVSGNYLSEEKQAMQKSDRKEPKPVEKKQENNRNPEFVNVKSLDSTIVVDLRYNTTNNFTGEKIYNFDQAILRKSTAQKLVNANSALKEHGYRLKIWDAYRPLFAQEKLWEVYPDSRFVAKPNPNTLKGHPSGATVDITLVTLDGQEVDMQTGFDDFTAKAHRNAEKTEEHARLYKILDTAMIEAGFEGYEHEWWHYNDTIQNFSPLQVDPAVY